MLNKSIHKKLNKKTNGITLIRLKKVLRTDMWCHVCNTLYEILWQVYQHTGSWCFQSSIISGVFAGTSFEKWGHIGILYATNKSSCCKARKRSKKQQHNFDPPPQKKEEYRTFLVFLYQIHVAKCIDLWSPTLKQR